MKEYSEEVIKALDGSIEKWINITYFQGVDGGTLNCLLCKMFHDSGSHFCCYGCPVMDYGHRFCRPHYLEFVDLASEDGKVHNEASAEAALKFLNLLKDIRKNVKVKSEVAKSMRNLLPMNTLQEEKFYKMGSRFAISSWELMLVTGEVNGDHHAALVVINNRIESKGRSYTGKFHKVKHFDKISGKELSEILGRHFADCKRVIE